MIKLPKNLKKSSYLIVSQEVTLVYIRYLIRRKRLTTAFKLKLPNISILKILFKPKSILLSLLRILHHLTQGHHRIRVALLQATSPSDWFTTVQGHLSAGEMETEEGRGMLMFMDRLGYTPSSFVLAYYAF